MEKSEIYLTQGVGFLSLRDSLRGGNKAGFESLRGGELFVEGLGARGASKRAKNGSSIMDENESRLFPVGASSKNKKVPSETMTEGVLREGGGGAAVGPGVREADGRLDADGDKVDADAEAVENGTW